MKPALNPHRGLLLALCLLGQSVQSHCEELQDSGYGDGSMVDPSGYTYFPQPDGSYTDAYGHLYVPDASGDLKDALGNVLATPDDHPVATTESIPLDSRIDLPDDDLPPSADSGRDLGRAQATGETSRPSGASSEVRSGAGADSGVGSGSFLGRVPSMYLEDAGSPYLEVEPALPATRGVRTGPGEGTEPTESMRTAAPQTPRETWRRPAPGGRPTGSLHADDTDPSPRLDQAYRERVHLDTVAPEGEQNSLLPFPTPRAR